MSPADAVASGAPRQRFFELECLRDEGDFRNPPFALRGDEPGDGAETNERMLATVSRESPNESAASARVSGWSGTSAVEKGFGTLGLYHGCARRVAVETVTVSPRRGSSKVPTQSTDWRLCSRANLPQKGSTIEINPFHSTTACPSP